MVAAALLGEAVKFVLLAIAILLSLPAQGANFNLLIQGLGGTEAFDSAFSTDARRIEAAYSRESLLSGKSVYLHDENAKRKKILEVIDEFSRAMSKDDRFTLTLIGHGSYDGREYKFNLPGPDLSGSDLTDILQQIPAGRQLIVLATSSSGAMLKSLQKSGRTVITATKSGNERNAVSFSKYWASALDQEIADKNKDELLSVEEAFQYAAKKVKEKYIVEGLLASEHPRMSNASDVMMLARFGRLAGSEDNPGISDLLTQRLSIAMKFYQLKERKKTMHENEYLDALEIIMLEMARVQQELDEQLDRLEGNHADS